MVTALDLASDKNAEISALAAQLLQAKSKALLYEVTGPCPAVKSMSLAVPRCMKHEPSALLHEVGALLCPAV